MKFRVASDIHLEFYGKDKKTHVPYYKSSDIISPLSTDKESILVLAGDIGLVSKPWTYEPFLADMANRFKHVVYVLGNHEYYKTSLDVGVSKLKDKLSKFGIHILDDESIIIDDVTVIGSTLWTDYDNNNQLLKNEARYGMSDYKYIRVSRDEFLYGRRATPNDMLMRHYKSKMYIFDELKKLTTEKSLVVTHHAPSYTSIGKDFIGDSLNGCYANTLDKEIEETGPNVWVHGHIHSVSDYMIGNTRVLANPRGYLDELNYNYNNSIVFDL